jgi:hypothetical protein
MFTHAKGVLIVICVLLCTLALMGGGPNAPQTRRVSQDPRPEPVLDARSTLVEAFVIEVNLPALAKLGVSPIGEDPHAVSVPDLLKCLDNGQARVIAGAKAACQEQQGETQVETKKTTYLRREKGSSSDVSPYQTGRELSVATREVSDRAAVSVEFSFEHAAFGQNAQDAGVPPDLVSWTWRGRTILETGKPEIAAATQDEDKAVFLVLTAHMREP